MPTPDVPTPRCGDAVPVTRLLEACNHGEPGAHARLIAAVYAQLRRIAQRQLDAERGYHTLQPTAVVHEAYARLAGSEPIEWSDTRHFFAVATTTMRRILVDHARARAAVKRSRPPGGGAPWAIDAGLVAVAPAQLLAIDLALSRLHAIDPDKGSLVQLRFFGGLSFEELAELLGCSRATVVRQWRVARAWLFNELGGGAR
ncbi:MAG: RNA polymerase subunit sigma-70 [Deltaproteobacteria bacterium]|nr:RNA polymerase subunit sigma-70 [Deltaproteobacteria bacterium]